MDILVEKKTIFRILKHKKEIEEKLLVKIKIKDEKIEINGEADKEFIAEKAITALDFGFPIDVALLLTDENYVLEILNIKNITRRKKLEEVRGRVIGKQGKTLQLICTLSNCFIELKENEVAIIGDAEDIKDVVNAMTSLIRGSKQGNVYSYLEKARARKKISL